MAIELNVIYKVTNVFEEVAGSSTSPPGYCEDVDLRGEHWKTPLGECSKHDCAEGNCR